jgi:predicted acylesterase/phospholipase RssA
MSGKTYVDGGVVSLVAVDVARRYGADVVIALRSNRDVHYILKYRLSQLQNSLPI